MAEGSALSVINLFLLLNADCARNATPGDGSESRGYPADRLDERYGLYVPIEANSHGLQSTKATRYRIT
jgi:hypothetical protein